MARAEAMLVEALALPRSVPDMSRREMRRRIGDMVRQGKTMSLRNIPALVRGIDYKSSSNVAHAIDAAAAWLKRKVGSRPYAIVAYSSRGMKSDTWLAPRVVEAIGRMPEALVPLVETTGLSPESRRARLAGVKAFVYLDDATYSGEQLEEVAGKFLGMRRAGGPAWADAKLYMAVGFASPHALARLQVVQGAGAVEVHAAGTMRTLHNLFEGIRSPETANRISKFLTSLNPFDPSAFSKLGRSMGVLAHKVPDEMSIPEPLSLVLSDTSVRPPYDARLGFLNRAWSPVRSYSRNGTRYVLFVHADGTTYTRVGYALNRAGRLRKTEEKTWGAWT